MSLDIHAASKCNELASTTLGNNSVCCYSCLWEGMFAAVDCASYCHALSSLSFFSFVSFS